MEGNRRVTYLIGGIVVLAIAVGLVAIMRSGGGMSIVALSEEKEVPPAKIAAPTFRIANLGTLGDGLAGDNGMTLYTFASDTPGVSTCTGDCAKNWPPLTVPDVAILSAAPGLMGAVTTFVREDGSLQVVYEGKPLYFFANDTEEGDTLGEGVKGVWSVARPVSGAVSPTGVPSVKGTPEPVKSIMFSEVALHATPTDCWMVIAGKVYDVSNGAPTHPGGEALYMGCGKDATQMFDGKPHSETARSYLPQFEIGVLGAE